MYSETDFQSGFLAMSLVVTCTLGTNTAPCQGLYDISNKLGAGVEREKKKRNDSQTYGQTDPQTRKENGWSKGEG